VAAITATNLAILLCAENVSKLKYINPIPQDKTFTETKPGECPTVWGGGNSRIGICSQECSSDSDCGADMKCCSNGCGTSCMLPQSEVAAPNYPPGPDPAINRNEQPPRIFSSLTEVEAEEGSLASLECLCRGNPLPQISWRFNSAEVS
jgi:hypothetical protein